MAQKPTGGRFASLRSLRSERQDETAIKPTVESKPDSELKAPQVEPEPEVSPPQATHQRRRPGRPPGRRSNPDYTQLSAYIPLELLLAVQDELAQERREQQQRTARPVSDLIEDLLGQWLQEREAGSAKRK